ncbi:glyoxylate/hydroxypyruvate reductase A [Herbaspirillum lusitanum]|uniref:Glyoxylate/hydroxypyruvate reductase A n=1 Tax=Herbaspirillum lusitanum TaxID=213312 RepID=A0ABW9ADF8_9BURK
MNNVSPQAPIPFIARCDAAQCELWLTALRLAMPDENIVAFATLDADARAACKLAIVANPDPAEVAQLPQLEWVHSVWAGVEKMVAELGDSGLQIVRLVDPQLAATMAEAVLAWSLYLHRDMPAYARLQQTGQWQQLDYVRPQNRTVSLLGLGALGDAAARQLLNAGFKVCGWSRQLKNIPGVATFAGDEGLQAMLQQTDILVCLLPLTAQTRHLLNAERLSWLSQDATLINFARGPIIDDEALRAALDQGRLKHAVLDVFATEPLPSDAWQWPHPAVTVLPHISAPTDRETASAIVAGNIRAYRADGSIPPTVDLSRGY